MGNLANMLMAQQPEMAPPLCQYLRTFGSPVILLASPLVTAYNGIPSGNWDVPRPSELVH